MRVWVNLLVAGVFLAGCTGADLTREQAAEMIQKSEKFTDPVRSLQLSDETLSVAVSAGLLEKKVSGGFKITTKGETVFRFINNDYGTWAKLQKPPTPEVVEVTGISNPTPMPDRRDVAFTWRYKMKDETARQLFGEETRTGRAVFERFDDGWRLKELQ